MLTLPVSEPVAARSASCAHGSWPPRGESWVTSTAVPNLISKFRCRGSYRLSVNHTLPSKFHRHRFFVLINTCYSAFQKGKEKRKKKKREVEETAANCLKFKKNKNLNIYNIFCSNIWSKLLGSKLAKGNMVNLHVMSGLCIFFDYFKYGLVSEKL